MKITSCIAAGEGARAKKLALAIMDDLRFEPLEVNADIPLDVQFSIESICNECIDGHNADYQNCLRCAGTGKVRNIFNAEFKEPADYISSALSPTGHLYMQLLAAREAGHRCGVAVLGGDNQVTEAIINALKTRYHGKELAFNIASYEARLIDFEAQCEAIRCPVWRWQASPYKRLLSNAHKILTGGDLMGYRPRPAEGERELVAACGLTKGIGPETWKNILTQYQLGLFPRGDYAKPIEEMAGIGKVRAAQIAPLIRMVYANRVRA